MVIPRTGTVGVEVCVGSVGQATHSLNILSTGAHRVSGETAPSGGLRGGRTRGAGEVPNAEEPT